MRVNGSSAIVSEETGVLEERVGAVGSLSGRRRLVGEPSRSWIDMQDASMAVRLSANGANRFEVDGIETRL